MYFLFHISAVQVEKHIPQPHDENLDWVQIKIPKDMK